MINLAIFQRINAEFIQQAEKCFWKDELPSKPEISTGRAIACINATALCLMVSSDCRVALGRVFPLSKVRHECPMAGFCKSALWIVDRSTRGIDASEVPSFVRTTRSKPTKDSS